MPDIDQLIQGSVKVGAYYYGRRRWDDYLVDLTNAVRTGAAQNASSIAKGSATIAQAIASESSQLQSGLDRANQSISELRSELGLGFGLLAERLDQQAEYMNQMLEELRGIHQTLRSPLLTQADEYYRIGRAHLSRGLYQKALEAFLKSEELHDVNCGLQLQIGELYFEGVDEFDNLIDLEKAEMHFILAAKYARALEHELKNWWYFYDNAWLQAANVRYVRSSEAYGAGDTEGAAAHMQKALQYASYQPLYRDRAYMLAKCLARTGDHPEAFKTIRNLADSYAWFLPKAEADPDFEGLRPRIRALRSLDGPEKTAAKEWVAHAEEVIGELPRIDTHKQFTPKITGLQKTSQELRTEVSSDCAVFCRVRDRSEKLYREAGSLGQKIFDTRLARLEENKRDAQSASYRVRTKRKQDPFWVWCALLIVFWPAGALVAWPTVYFMGSGRGSDVVWEVFPLAIKYGFFIAIAGEILFWANENLPSLLAVSRAESRERQIIRDLDPQIASTKAERDEFVKRFLPNSA